MSVTSEKLRFTFRKSERLTSKKILESLIEDGIHSKSGAFSLISKKTELPYKTPVQIAFSVPKKNVRSATDRNTVKRRMREAFRKNKHTLHSFAEKESIQLALLLVYYGKNIPQMNEVEEKIILLLRRLAENFEKNTH